MDDASDCRFSVQECEKILTQLISSDPGKLRVTIVIDALDECEDHGDELLQILSRLVRCRPQSVRLLLSSQMHVDVTAYFKDQGVVSIEVNAAQTNDDMMFFIEEEMNRQRSKPLQGILRTDQELWAKVRMALSHRANGMLVLTTQTLLLIMPKLIPGAFEGSNGSSCGLEYSFR